MAKFMRCDRCKKEIVEQGATPTGTFSSGGFVVHVSASATARRGEPFGSEILSRDLCRDCVVGVIKGVTVQEKLK